MLAILLPAAGILPPSRSAAATPSGSRSAPRRSRSPSRSRCSSKCSAPGAPIVYVVAGFPPPLGIALRADGISAVMLVTTRSDPPGRRASSRAPASPRRPARMKARKAACLLDHAAGDLALRSRSSSSAATCSTSMSLSSCLLSPQCRSPASTAGRRRSPPRLRYLLFALFGSIFYLLGAALLYGAFGTLDIALLAERIRPAAGGHGRGGADDRGATRQDCALPAASLAAAGPRQRSGAGERGAVRPGRQGLVLSGRAAVVLCPAGSPGESASTRFSARSGRPRVVFGSVLALRQRAAQAAHRLFDHRPDRISLPDLPAGLRGSTRGRPTGGTAA